MSGTRAGGSRSAGGGGGVGAHAEANRGGGGGAAEDAYLRHLRSETYRRERAEKAEVILALCGRELARARRVADLGAGTGLIKKALEEKLGKFLYGFDMDRAFMLHASGMVVADATRLPVPAGAFDFLLLNHLYEHVQDQEALFREAFRALASGGLAYVAAGNRLAVTEPHYRLPFLSWLPRPAADRYLRLTGRGRCYEGIRFRIRRPLLRMIEAAGFEVEDRTEDALRLARKRPGGRWRRAAAMVDRLPVALRRTLLHWASPQWFFLLRKPPEGPGADTARAEGTAGSR